MRRLLLCLLILSALLFAGDKKGLPRVLLAARYVYVTDIRGSDVTDIGTNLDDREIRTAVEEKIREWGRYAITMHPENADLIIVVRKGRSAGVTIGSRRRFPDGPSGPVIGGETGPPDDYLAVHTAQQGIDGPPLWRASAKDGLRIPAVRLFERFKKEIEETAALDRQKKSP